MATQSNAPWANSSTPTAPLFSPTSASLDLPTLLFYLAIVIVPSLLFKNLKRKPALHPEDDPASVYVKTPNGTSPRPVNGVIPPLAKYPGKFPGPKLYPIVGRVHDLPRFSMWLKFKEWADEFGPIYETRMVDQKFIIVSDESIARELLVRHGNNFAGRPQIRALINHKAGPVYSALMDRHETWKYQRRWVHSAMVAAHQHHFFGNVEREVKRYLATIVIDPSKFIDYTRELTGRVTSRLAWDDATQGKLNGDLANRTLTQMSVSGPIINTMTPLWTLGDLINYNPWRKDEIAREHALKSWWVDNLLVARKRFQEGSLPQDTWCFKYFEQMIENGNPTLEMDDKQLEMASCMLGFQALVGAVTLSGPMQFFIMCMGLHPEWLKKCQDEIDRVCGDRMPCIADSPNLPTVRACLKETVRWRSGVPLGVPHQCETTTDFRGVTIEKGTIILACEWNMNRVIANYPDPETYNPARYLDPAFPTYQEPLTRYPNFREGKGMHSFGWGRRTCLGQTIADDETFVAGAGLCWAFNIQTKKCPLTGEPVAFDSQATNSNVILEPLPFPMDITPRSAERRKQVLDNYDAVVGEIRV